MKSDSNDELNYWPSFADIFSSLFFIFFILFSFFYFYYGKSIEVDRKDIQDLKELKLNLPMIELDTLNNEIIIPENLLFDLNKSNIRKRYYPFVDSLRTELAKYFREEDRNKRYLIIVEGHTDTVGDKNYNYRLSLERSLNLINLLNRGELKESNIEFVPAAYGESKLKVKTPDNTFEKKNRRVVIRIVPTFTGTSVRVLGKK